jgi:hypothetical protein
VKRSAHSRDVVDAAIAGEFAALLKGVGFRKAARNWRRRVSEPVQTQIVNVQASSFNMHELGLVTINLAVYDEMFQAAAERHIESGYLLDVGEPVERICVIRTRVGRLMPLSPPQIDHWWNVTPRTDANRLSRTLAETISDIGLPWFEKMRDRKAAITFMKQVGCHPKVLNDVKSQLTRQKSS